MAVSERFEYESVEGIRVGRLRFKFNTTCIVYCLGQTGIDCGPSNQWRFVKSFLRRRKVSRVLLTHHHEDHAGNGMRCQQELGIDVLASAACRQLVETTLSIPSHRRLCWGNLLPFSPQVIDEVVELEQGMTLRAIPCPGHADDMVCYLEPQRGWLFSGDLYVASNTKYMLKDENPHLMIESLKTVLSYDFDTLFCSHRGVIRRGRRALRKKLEFLQTTLETVRQMRDKGISEHRITRTLLGREDWMTLVTQYHFSKRNFIERLLDDPS